MYTHHLFSSLKPDTQIVLLIVIALSTCFARNDAQYRGCPDKPYNCGAVRNLTYPFCGEDQGRPEFCGHKDFNLTCVGEEYPIINIDGVPFRIHHVSQSTNTMNLSRVDLQDGFCSVPEPKNATFDGEIFKYDSTAKPMYVYYDCEPDFPPEFSNFSCKFVDDGIERTGFYTDSLRGDGFGKSRCTGIQVWVTEAALDGLLAGLWDLKDALNRGVDVNYNAYNTDCSRCEGGHGICGSGAAGTDTEFVCIHAPRRNSRVARKIGIGFGAAGFTFLVMAVLFFIYHRRNKRRYAPPSWVSRSMSSYPSSIKDLEKTGTYFGVQIFSYEELEKATNYFDSKKELGDGGYGTVYQGKLKDGRDIAVKRLYEHNYNRVEQFMNEVEILTRLRHQNLVSLYGFTSRHCRELLLVYEYISNGTVADHLHGERAHTQPLSWAHRLSISVETASALTYLHASDIIHRDVKTNNILLDNNFKVKVADFGLSRLVPTDVTHVSTAPQGTPGYVDPDYHECYQLTAKSDVYSFGVVLIELVSSKPAVDIGRHRHEINLSNMAINKIQSGELHELVDPSLGFESDVKVRNMISDVAELAFRCLQSGKDMRPSMVEAHEILKRIQSDGFDVKNADEIGDVGKESGIVPTLSPDSVTTPWISKDSTPNTSS